MDDLDLPRPPPAVPAEPAFDLRRPRGAAVPLVFASPHSGRLYPDDLMAASALGSHAPAAVRGRLGRRAAGRRRDARRQRAVGPLRPRLSGREPGGLRARSGDVRRRAAALRAFAHAQSGRGTGLHRPHGGRGSGDLRPQAVVLRGARADRGGAPALSRDAGRAAGRGEGRVRARGVDRLALHAVGRGPARPAQPQRRHGARRPVRRLLRTGADRPGRARAAAAGLRGRPQRPLRRRLHDPSATAIRRPAPTSCRWRSTGRSIWTKPR